LTQAMRNLEAEHRAELDNLDELIAATKRKKGYVEFAYNCFKPYTSTGELSWALSGDSNPGMYEEVEEWFKSTGKLDEGVLKMH
jgi:hypothetical protein